jgi:aspartate carbamoyltransferase regulatory subunit
MDENKGTKRKNEDNILDIENIEKTIKIDFVKNYSKHQLLKILELAKNSNKIEITSKYLIKILNSDKK